MTNKELEQLQQQLVDELHLSSTTKERLGTIIKQKDLTRMDTIIYTAVNDGLPIGTGKFINADVTCKHYVNCRCVQCVFQPGDVVDGKTQVPDFTNAVLNECFFTQLPEDCEIHFYEGTLVVGCKFYSTQKVVVDDARIEDCEIVQLELSSANENTITDTPFKAHNIQVTGGELHLPVDFNGYLLSNELYITGAKVVAEKDAYYTAASIVGCELIIPYVFAAARISNCEIKVSSSEDSTITLGFDDDIAQLIDGEVVQKTVGFGQYIGNKINMLDKSASISKVIFSGAVNCNNIVNTADMNLQRNSLMEASKGAKNGVVSGNYNYIEIL